MKIDDLGSGVVALEGGVGFSTKNTTDARVLALLEELSKRNIPLVSLALDESFITRNTIECIIKASASTLRWLDLSDNGLKDDDIEPIKEAKALKKLYLDNNYLSSPAIASLQSSLPQLELLSAKPSPFFEDSPTTSSSSSPDLKVTIKQDNADGSYQKEQPFTPLAFKHLSEDANLGKRKAAELFAEHQTFFETAAPSTVASFLQTLQEDYTNLHNKKEKITPEFKNPGIRSS